MSETTSSIPPITKSTEQILKEINEKEQLLKQQEEYIENVCNDARNIVPKLYKLNIFALCIYAWLILLIPILYLYHYLKETKHFSTKNLNIYLYIMVILFSIHYYASFGIFIYTSNKYNDSFLSTYFGVYVSRHQNIKEIKDLYKSINKTDISEIVSENHNNEFKIKYPLKLSEIIPSELINISNINKILLGVGLTFVIAVNIYLIGRLVIPKSNKPAVVNSNASNNPTPNTDNNNAYLEVGPAVESANNTPAK